jgi:hypothetical protein
VNTETAFVVVIGACMSVFATSVRCETLSPGTLRVYVRQEVPGWASGFGITPEWWLGEVTEAFREAFPQSWDVAFVAEVD